MKEAFCGLGIIGILFCLLFFGKHPVQEEQVRETAVGASEQQILVRFATGAEWMNLEEYLVGAVYGEMPAQFEEEALKAQAVAARTFALKAARTGGKHGDTGVCTDAACCQAYRTPDGEAEPIRQAVLQTEGEVLTYQGEMIDAVYFSCSGGSTEDAVAVWGQEVPYLQSVDSPGEEGAGAYLCQRRFGREELEEALGVTLSEEPEQWFRNPVYTEGGGISVVEAGGKVWTGVELRRLLGLRSTKIRLHQEGQTLVITTYGYGHRVGMSQYGADAMAAGGADYRQILAHYYTGTELMVY